MNTQAINVSWFPILGVTDNGTIKPHTEIIDLIRSGSHNTTDHQWNFRRTGNKYYKKRLPLVIWQAECKIREAKHITIINGFMVADFDHIGVIGINQLRERAMDDPNVVAAFKSPSIDGYKIIFMTDVTDPTIYQMAYYLLLEKLERGDVYKLFKPDKSVSNVSRGHFVPHDPEIYYNDNPIPIELDALAQSVPYYSNSYQVSGNYLVIILDKILDYYGTNFKDRISVCDDYSQWMSYGYALFNSFPNDEETAENYFRRFSSLSPKFKTMEEGDFQTVVERIIAGRNDGNSIMKIIGEAKINGYDFQYSLKDLELDLSGKSITNDKLPNACFPLLKNGQYLSDIQFDTGTNVLLESPTNSGKSEYFIKHAKGKRILLVPTIDLAKQLAGNPNQDLPIKAVYAGVTVSGEEPILIGTYDSIFKLIRLDNLHEYELWIDEAHNFILSSSTSFRNEQLTTIYTSLDRFKRVVVMTGTNIDNDYLFPISEGFQKVVVNMEDRPEKRLILVETPDKKASIIKRLKRGSLNVIFYNNKAEGENLGKYLEDVHKYKVQLFNRDTKETDEHKAIITDREVKEGVEVLIATSLYGEGISIYNLNYSGVHIMGSVSWVDIEQLGSRSRKVTPPIFMYINKDKKFFYKYFNFNTAIDQRLKEAQKVADILNTRVDELSIGSKLEDLENERMIVCEKESRSPYNWVNIFDNEYEVNRLAAINDAYLAMKISHYVNIQQLLMELVPYNYKFNVELDDVEALSNYCFSKDKMTKEQVDEFLELYSTIPTNELVLVKTGDDATSEILMRLRKIRMTLRDEDVESAFREYGTSKKAFMRFLDGLDMQLLYDKYRKEAKEPILLKGMMSNFKIGSEYTNKEVLKKLKKLQKTRHLFAGVNLEKRRLVYYLRQFYEVESVEGNGRKTSYIIKSKNVTGYKLDCHKIKQYFLFQLNSLSLAS